MSDTGRTSAAATVRLADYRPPVFAVDTVELTFELDPAATRVTSRLAVRRTGDGPLVLDGHGLQTVRVAVDGIELGTGEYRIDDTSLTIDRSGEAFIVETECVIDPDANTALSGLYRSSGNYCTQCEPEGFRRITWYPDRPDVLSVFTTTIIADASACPVLLANGNLVEVSDLDDGRRRAVWHDPWPKPSYLFALVAGDLGCLEDTFVTRSGRRVALKLYTEHHNMDQLDHAMASLKKSMKWDEDVYGREYDLDTYMIVAVDDFNMGAMENKGLNVFNTRYVLARPETATDADYEGIEGVIAHEYFHNWSGNRVTCRDWFQLSLKEGFTVFRDQQFSADMGSAGVKRIADVNLLRAHQFPEDSGPMAHPVRPDTYVEINNFYTMTVYNKGAEVIRMLYNLLGADQFRAGCDLYFERHDGQAVTTDDFVRAHEDAASRSLVQFRRWYTQAGTPRVTVNSHYDEAARTVTLTMSQHCPPTPGQPSKEPFHIPVKGALFAADGRPLASRVEGETDAVHEHVFELTGASQTFVLHDVDAPAVPSLLRGFSAPVRLDAGLDTAGLGILVAHDNDPFNRWDAAQRLALGQIVRALPEAAAERAPSFDEEYLTAFGALLDADIEDKAFQALALALPDHAIVSEEVETVDPLAIHRAIGALERTLAVRFADAMATRYRNLAPGAQYAFEPGQNGRRALRNRMLAYLAAFDPDAASALAAEQFAAADNMTARMGALWAACANGLPGTDALLERFLADWRDHSLIVDKWFRLQATSPTLGSVERLRELVEHPAYSATNPNKVRAVVGAFCHANPARFHARDGSGYDFVTGQILALDKVNPQITARLAGAFNSWRRFAAPWRDAMRERLERIAGAPGLSRDTGEIVGRALAGD